MISVHDIRSLTDFQRHTKVHLKRLKASGRPIVQDAGAFEEMLDAIRGIQRGLDTMKEGTGKPFRAALDEIRAKHGISRNPK
jgi:hypothetical protein